MMKIDRRRTGLLIAAALGLLALTSAAAPNGPVPETSGGPEADGAASDRPDQPLLQNWPERSRTLVLAMTEKYGEPNRINAFEAVWYDNGPWRRTVVHRNSWSPFLGVRDNDCLEQTIAYRVNDDRLWDLKRFGKRIEIDQTAGELSSRAESESLNFLALNLAQDIAAGKRSAQNARGFYAQTEKLEKSGKTSPYLEGFGYWVDGQKAAEPARSALPGNPGREEFH